MLEKIKLPVDGAFILKLNHFEDDRGYFQEIFSDRSHKWSKWKQANLSSSKKGVVRGFHVAPFNKLCTCLRGRILDVVVDLRKDSPTYMRLTSVWLTGTNQIFVPKNCGHGFFSAEDDSLLMYLQDDVYSPGKEKEVHWQSVGFVWPPAEKYIVSEKDANAPPLNEYCNDNGCSQ